MNTGRGPTRQSVLAVAILSSALGSCQDDETAAPTAQDAGTPAQKNRDAGRGNGEAGADATIAPADGTAPPDAGSGSGGAGGASGGFRDASSPVADVCEDPGRKRCGGFCVTPRPAVGCDSTGCDPCPDVPHGYAVCVGTQCDFDCEKGAIRNGNVCTPVDGGIVEVSCTNGVRDGIETDIDCGGVACPACALGKRCATLSDCESGQCDPSSQTCTCKPLTCPDVTGACGALSDGCGGTITCAGTCDSGVCFNGRCCTPRIEAECGADACGQTDDGCGGFLSCGVCAPPAVCGLVVVGRCSTDATCVTDTDSDGLDDCAEDNDGDAWTDKNVFNGVAARLADACNPLNDCSPRYTDTLSEVESCYSRKSSLETRNQFAGWDFTTTSDQSCSASYGFQPTWTVCRSRFSVDARARINLPADDTYCFAIDGESTNQCASFFFDAETAALGPTVARRCYTSTAGEHMLHWLYTVDSGAGNRRFRLLFCRGAFCTPTESLPSYMLRLP